VHVQHPGMCVCVSFVLAGFAPVLKGRIFHRQTRLHARTLNCSLWYLPLALGHSYVFGYLEHTHAMYIEITLFALCVRIKDLANLQHAQHIVQKCLHSHDGRVARMLPYHFEPQECVCMVCFSWF